MIAIYFFAATAAALVGSFWIDCLYKLPNAPLTFSDKILERGRFRKILLTVIFFVAILFSSEIPKSFAAYNLTAIFFLSLITMTDFEQYIIFDKMLLPFALASLPFIFILELPLPNHLSAALIGGGFFFFLMALSKNALGGGDVKLIFVLGLWFGENLLPIILAGTIFAGFFALIFLSAKIKSRKDFFAYGPYFCIAAFLYLIFDFKIF